MPPKLSCTCQTVSAHVAIQMLQPLPLPQMPQQLKHLGAGFQSDATSSNMDMGGSRESGGKGALRRYIESFGPDTVQEMARVVSQEAATIIDMQSVALFGDYRVLQEQMEVRRQRPLLQPHLPLLTF